MEKLTQAAFVAKALSRAKRPISLDKFEYRGSAVKGTATCPSHGDFQITPNSLMNRIGCAACAVIERSRKRSLTKDEFIERALTVHQQAYCYEKVEYVNSQTKVIIKCPKHGEFLQSPSSHLSGKGCSKCGDESVGEKCRTTQEEFLSRCRDVHGDKYDLSRVAYLGMSKKIEVSCQKHGVFTPLASNFVGLGTGCPSCGRELVGVKSRKKESEYIEKALAVHQGAFSYGSVVYKNKQAYLTVICNTHGSFEQLAGDHLKGIGCRKCSKPVFDTQSFMDEGRKVHDGKYTYENSSYVGAFEKVKITCPEHGTFEQLPSCHVSLEQGCPRCAGVGPSKSQVEIADFLSAHTAVLMESTIPGSKRRLDMYLPEHNLAIEFHGLIWHSTAFQADPLKDFKKHKAAEACGIRVIHIYQDEWVSKRRIVERTLLSAIGKGDRVFARRTKLNAVDKQTANEFFEKNHLQGAPNSSLFLGLFLGNEMVACMSFAVARSVRKNADQQLWELQRYASVCSVVGGASKLLKHFISMGKCHTLISYSDTRLFSGCMYKALGFELEHETPPDYCYVSNSLKNGRVHKSKFQRKHLPNRLAEFDPSKSEVRNCFDNGWYQLFDCGKKKWVLRCK